MEPQHMFTFNAAQDQLMFDFDFDFDFLVSPVNSAANPLNHTWPQFELDLPLPPIPGSVDDVFAQNNSATSNSPDAVIHETNYVFGLGDIVDDDTEKTSEEIVFVSPRATFEPLPLLIAADDETEHEHSDGDDSEYLESTSVADTCSSTEPLAITPSPVRRSPRNHQLLGNGSPGPSTVTLDSTPTRKVSLKRKRVDEVSSAASILAFTAQGSNKLITPAMQSSSYDGPATRRRKVTGGTAMPVAQPNPAYTDSSTHPKPLPRLLEIGQGFERPEFALTHKRGRGSSWNSTACLMCGVPRRRRKLNDTAHTHRSAKPKNKGRMPYCKCMQAIDVQYDAKSKSDYKHTNIANFGLVLLYRYPELADNGFQHDQITGVAARELKKWWGGCEDLQKAHAEERLLEALKDAAGEADIESSLP